MVFLKREITYFQLIETYCIRGEWHKASKLVCNNIPLDGCFLSYQKLRSYHLNYRRVECSYIG